MILIIKIDIMKKLFSSSKNNKKILFLGCDKSETKLIDELVKSNCQVFNSKKMINSTNFDLIISFGFRFIIPKNFLKKKAKCPIINIHISYLPFNRGSHPNFLVFL